MDALVDWERRDRGAMRAGLDSMRDLVWRLGSPEGAAKVVHVAGSKGKGSVARLVAAGLQRAGLKVGVYASPHVERTTERVVIDGQPVSDDELAVALEEAMQARENGLRDETPAGRATWFDLMTAAALLVFERARVDWSVIEVGLGGRLDSSNVVQAEVCVITSIELEHTAVLGDTKRAIALEKAGILGRGGVLVSGVVGGTGLAPEDDARTAIEERALELGVQLQTIEPSPGATITDINRGLAASVLDELGRLGHQGAAGVALGGAQLDEWALEAAQLPGRLERRRLGELPVVLDGAHVASSLGGVLDELGSDSGLVGGPVAVLALGRDKDCEAFLKALKSAVDTLACTFVEGSQHVAPSELAARARALGFSAEAFECPSEALAWAAQRAHGRWVLATGSLYLVGALRALTAPAESPRC